MFGRRRRRLAASAAISVAGTPILTDEQIFELLHDRIDALIGARGAWTLTARNRDDTEVIFHDLKAREIATELTEAIVAEQAALRGESSGEPTALSWTPAPIAVWNDPDPVVDADNEDRDAASAAWLDSATATLDSARLSPKK